jgi:hypothetical protein
MKQHILFAAVAAMLCGAQAVRAANLLEFDAEGRLIEARVEDGFSSDAMGLRFQRAEGPITIIASSCRQEQPGTVECWLKADNPLGGLVLRKQTSSVAKIDGEEMGVKVEHWRRKVVLRVTPKPVKLNGGKDSA